MDEDYYEIDPDIESSAEMNKELNLKDPEQKKEFLFWWNTLTIIGGILIVSIIVIGMIVVCFF
jgi:heme/copper-type cytochrome/quinol oxidase subunit 2